MIDQIALAADFLASRLQEKPRIGMITGTGLGSLTESMRIGLRIPYEEIPHFPRSTVPGHKGALVWGRIEDRPVMAMEGRFHLYEGYTPFQVTFPVRVMAALGVNFLLISSAAGGLNPRFQPADLMIVTDHINLTGTNPLMGPNLDAFGPRFPDMAEVYDSELIAMARGKAIETGLLLKEGVYVGVSGPSLETPSETRFLRMIGADAVGMSTVSEAITGAHCGMKIMAIVVITNVNLPDCMRKTSIEDVIDTAGKAGSNLATLWRRIIGSLSLERSL
jgi:purine-nucleoside phosphorylase